MKDIKGFIIFASIVLVIMIWFFVRFMFSGGLIKDLDSDKEKDIVFLITTINNEEKIDSANVIIMNNKNYYFLNYSINPDVSVMYDDKLVKLFNISSRRKFRKVLSGIIARPIDYYITLDNTQFYGLMDVMGGVSYFNIVSSNFQKGPVYLCSSNYQFFLNGLKDVTVYRDVAFSIWLNLIQGSLDLYNKLGGKNIPIGAIYNNLKTDLSRRDFKRLYNCLVDNVTNVYFDYRRMNVDSVEINNVKYKVPLKNGAYDYLKIEKLLAYYRSDEILVDCFPLTLQIKNATRHNRLAAFASGWLHYKHCDVREYMTSDFKLSNTILIDYCGSVVKRRYIKKINHIKYLYFDVNNKSEFDFTIYLGEDYYALKYFTNR